MGPPAVVRTLQIILKHPLNQGRPWQALSDYVRWQLGSRLVGGSVAVPFVGDARLLVDPGMTGATSNVYCKLGDYEEMGFLLHFLREGDLFLDLGANVGSYTMLAASVGSLVIAFEPIPFAADRFEANLRLNGFEELVELHRTAAGSGFSHLSMTTAGDTLNHIDLGDVAEDLVMRVPVEPIDSVVGDRDVTALKIDVEGWETEVLQGASELFARGGAGALIIELNGSGLRYGYRDKDIDQQLQRWGYIPIHYDPLTRRIAHRTTDASAGNVLYAREVGWVIERVESAPRRVLSRGLEL